MYCQLGHIAFQRQEYFAGLEGSKKFEYAEHAHVEGKPGLQAVGDALDTYTLEMVFHHFWCDPAASETKVAEAAARKEAQTLVFGDGTFVGKFVVTELTRTVVHQAPDGRLLMLTLRVALKEFYDHQPLETSRKRAVAVAPAVKVPVKPKPAPAKRAVAAARPVAVAKPKTTAKPGVKVKTGVPAFTQPWKGELFSNIPASEIARQ